MQGPSRSLTKVYLRPGGPGSSRATYYVVAVLGPYEPGLLGRQGDVIALTYFGPIPTGSEIPFEDLAGYRVVSRPLRPEGGR